MIFHITMEQVEDGWYAVECPALPGCISQGDDEQTAVANIKEAIAAWLWTDECATRALPEDRRSLVVIV